MTEYAISINGPAIYQGASPIEARTPDAAVVKYLRRGIRYTPHHSKDYSPKPQPPYIKLNWTATDRKTDKPYTGKIKLVLVPGEPDLYAPPSRLPSLIPAHTLDLFMEAGQ